MNSKLATLAYEMTVLTSAIAVHREKISAAEERADAIALAIEENLGFSPWEMPGHFDAWEAAKAEARALRDEDGFFWAESRVRDLAHFLGSKGETIPFSTGNVVWILGEMPEVHASVPAWAMRQIFRSMGEEKLIGKKVGGTPWGTIAA